MIKYHQNGIEPEYGKDHMLTNNWDQNKDYKNEYVNVHFRIEIQCLFDNFNKEEQNLFYNEVKSVLKRLGWKMKDNSEQWHCGYIVKGKQALYIHPQDFNGEILKNDVKYIAEALEKHNSFYLRWVDLYETVYDISDNKYKEYLKSKNNVIQKMLFEFCKTTRTNKFYNVFDICRKVSNNIRLVRLGLNDGRNFGSGQTIEYVQNIIKKMAAIGYLVLTKDNNYVRSINKTEQKHLKLIV